MVLDSLKNLRSITDKPDPAEIFVGFPHSCTFNEVTVECRQYQRALQSPVTKLRGYILRNESLAISSLCERHKSALTQTEIV